MLFAQFTLDPFLNDCQLLFFVFNTILSFYPFSVAHIVHILHTPSTFAWSQQLIIWRLVVIQANPALFVLIHQLQ